MSGRSASRERETVGCEEARRILWPLDRPRPHTEREAAARRHVEGCESCREFFRRDLAVARAIREHGLGPGAPRELRERVYAALARERAFHASGRQSLDGDARASRTRTAIAVGALLALIGLGGLAIAVSSDRPHDVYVQDFVSRAVEEEVVETEDPSRMARFFMRELGLSLPPVTLQDGRLSRAMICLIRGRRAAMVEYEVDGHTVAHYRLPHASGAGRTREVWISTERGVRVVHWNDGRFEHALVAELPEDRLARLARGSFGAP